MNIQRHIWNKKKRKIKQFRLVSSSNRMLRFRLVLFHLVYVVLWEIYVLARYVLLNVLEIQLYVSADIFAKSMLQTSRKFVLLTENGKQVFLLLSIYNIRIISLHIYISITAQVKIYIYIAYTKKNNYLRNQLSMPSSRPLL